MVALFRQLADRISTGISRRRIGSAGRSGWNAKIIQAERLKDARMFYSPVVGATHGDARIRWRSPYERFDLSVWAAIILRDSRLHVDLELGARLNQNGETAQSATATWGNDIASRLFCLIAVDEYYSSPGHHREPGILPRIYSVTRSDCFTLRAYLRASVSDRGYILAAGSDEEFFARDPRCLENAKYLLRQSEADLEYVAWVLASRIQLVLFPLEPSVETKT
jgi:hypothetical protein